MAVEKVQAHHHRPTLKQTNKPFKGGSKGALKAKGKATRNAPKNSHLSAAAASKQARRNSAKQLQASRRSELVENSRLFITSSSGQSVPRVVSVIALYDAEAGEGLSSLEAVKLVVSQFGDAEEIVQKDDERERMQLQDRKPIHVHIPSKHTVLQFVFPPSLKSADSILHTLLNASAADFTLFLLSPTHEVSSVGETLLRSIQSMGINNPMGVVVPPPSSVPSTSGSFVANNDIKRSLSSFLSYFFPSVASERIHSISTPSDVAMLVRSLCEKMVRPSHVGVLHGSTSWKDGRGRVVVESLAWEQQGEEGKGTLSLTGVVRGGNLKAGRFGSLGQEGEYMISKVIETSRLLPKHHKPNVDAEMSSSENAIPLSTIDDNSDVDSITSTNSGDPEGLGEQTWPTEEEIASAPANQQNSAKKLTVGKRKVPKGTSEYQAAWIESDIEMDEEEEEEGQGEVTAPLDLLDGKDEGAGAERMTDTASMMDADEGEMMDDQEEAEATKEDVEAARKLAAKTDASFPDEVDTPMHIPARERFAKYRGLKSFRTSEWDPYEDLPKDYGRCFEVDLRQWRSLSTKNANGRGDVGAAEGAKEGTRVIVQLKDVPRSSYDRLLQSPTPIVLWALFKHEHKFTVMNWSVQRNTEYEEDVKSKDTLYLVLGPRIFKVNPIFSQNNPPGGNNVHKFERFLRHGTGGAVGTAYLPMIFGHAPAITLRRDDSTGVFSLVGTGTVLGPEPGRIIAKRVILTGYPFKVHKRTATIRYMFFNQPDIDYFKPIQLRTKNGRTGHIKESLGTHGLFKAGFDGTLDQMDTVCLSLYKRCFPKWGKRWCTEEDTKDVEMT